MWSDADSAAYWGEIARERIADERKALALADPHRLIVQARLEAEYAPPAEPDPEYQRWWQACLEWMPPTEAAALRLAYAESLGGKPAGRAGQGSSIARSLGLEQSTYVCMLDRAEARLTVLAPLCRAGHSIQAVCRRVDQEPLRGATVAHSALVRAYSQTWSTLGAAAALGMSQSTVHKRITKMAESEPVLQAIKATRKIG